MRDIEEKFAGSVAGDWEIKGSTATMTLTPPSELADTEDFQVEAYSAYTKCMLDQGIGAGVAGAVGGCVAGSMAAGVGCIAGIIPGATAGYIGGVAAALWTCRDKL